MRCHKRHWELRRRTGLEEFVLMDADVCDADRIFIRDRKYKQTPVLDGAIFVWDEKDAEEYSYRV